MPLYAIDTIVHAGREYQPGAKLPDDAPDSLVERGLASKKEPEVEAPGGAGEPEADLSKLSADQLEALAETRGLDVSAVPKGRGRKPALVELLQPSDGQPPEQPS